MCSVCISFTLALISHLLDPNQSLQQARVIVLVSNEWLMALKCLREAKCVQVTDDDH